MGKHSGRHALQSKLKEMGYEMVEDELNEVFKRFKEVAEMKKGFTDEDLMAIVGDQMQQPKIYWTLKDLQVCMYYLLTYLFTYLCNILIIKGNVWDNRTGNSNYKNDRTR